MKELPSLKLSVPVGSGPGEMEKLPKSYSGKDVVLHLADNTRAGDGTRVTIDGKVKVTESKSCWVDVAWAAP